MSRGRLPTSAAAVLYGAAVMALSATAVVAQPNPFKLPKSSLKGATVSYTVTGDVVGTAKVAFAGDRFARTSTSTMRIMGKTTSVSDWMLTTPDSMYRADLIKKEGVVSANLLPLLAKAYDGLDGDGKKRFHQNAQDMGAMLSSAFGLGNVLTGETGGRKTYAGQECEERSIAGFSVCQMDKTPIVLHTAGTLVCMDFEETATEVSLSAPAGDAFTPPAGVTFRPDPRMANTDSLARGFVGYLASQVLTDSLTAAKAEMARMQADQKASGASQPTADQKAAMASVCEMMLSFDMGQVMADASTAWKKAMAEALKNEAKSQATRGLKGLIKKPKIP